ncbi:hypothetical protein SKAU_G00210440 [Synaphobranchus kaupii]|uniref:Uncharacterized protein n=1 Tax=Synaphobranchus kaupii TaxID=118154 RepID=A0A9Q1IU00_SYNKA|nr:hypothetical protein SKAU_G00210440 [Synaphobranchus kaupii]
MPSVHPNLCDRSDKNVFGSQLQVNQRCVHCEYTYQWSSQPNVNNIPAGNLHICAATLFTGSTFSKVTKFLDALNAQGISPSTFYKHQSKLLFPTINWQWNQDQAKVISDTKAAGDVILGGDMRADSPGHCAKYGSYSMMDLKSNKIIEIQLLQVKC